MWCNDTRLDEKLKECSTRAFVQIHVKAQVNNLIRIDLQTVLAQSIYTLHLLVKIFR